MSQAAIAECLVEVVERAEALYQVRGLPGDDNTEPLRSTPYPHPPIPDEPAIARVRERLKQYGLHPFSIPPGVDVERWLQGGRILWDGHPDTRSGKMDAETRGLWAGLRYLLFREWTSPSAPSSASLGRRSAERRSTPGGDTRVQANLQTLLNHLAFGMALQDAVEAPRLVTHSHPDTFSPHAAHPGLVTLEERIGEATCDRLAARGHRIERLDDRTHWTGGVCAVRRDLATGELEAAADPRRWSRALGW